MSWTLLLILSTVNCFYTKHVKITGISRKNVAKNAFLSKFCTFKKNIAHFYFAGVEVTRLQISDFRTGRGKRIPQRGVVRGGCRSTGRLQLLFMGVSRCWSISTRLFIEPAYWFRWYDRTSWRVAGWDVGTWWCSRTGQEHVVCCASIRGACVWFSSLRRHSATNLNPSRCRSFLAVNAV